MLNQEGSLPFAILRSRRLNGVAIEISQCSTGCEDIWGLTEQEIRQEPKRIFEMVHPEDIDGLRASIEAAEVEGGNWSHSWRIHTPSGEIKTLEGKGTPDHPLGQGHWTLCIVDLTTQSKSISALAESERNFRELSENVPGAIFRYLLGPSGIDEIEFMSQGCQDLWEISSEEIAKDPSPLWDMVLSEDLHDMQQSVLRSAEIGDPWHHRWRIQTPSGKLKWLEGRGRPTRLGNGFTRWNSLIFDVTEQRMFEDELVSLRDEAAKALVAAENANRSKSEFLATMSHDLRTPLNAIIGFSDVISNEYFGPVGNNQYRDYAQDICTSASLLLTLINDILDLSRIEAGKFTVSPTRVSLADEVAFSTRLFQTEAEQKRIDVVSDVDKGLPTVLADSRALQQVLNNILSNAIRYSDPGSRVEISASELSTSVKLRIRDYGKGISETDLKRVLRAFETTNRDPHVAREGHGLGLFIVDSLCKLMNIEFWIESKVGEGTECYLKIDCCG